MNQQGPPCKAKYFWVTDSEIVPWGKGEIEPLLGSEIEHESLSLQMVGELESLTICLLKNEPATYRGWLWLRNTSEP